MNSSLKRLFISGMTVALLFSAQATNANDPKATSTAKATEKVTNDNAELSVKLYKTLAGGKTNLFLSPYSIQSVMTMIYVGADDNTAKELAGALQVKDDKKAVHASYKKVALALRKTAKETKNPFFSANGLCITNGAVSAAYKKLLRAVYGAEVFNGGVNVINDWVRKRTRGKIPKILDRLHPLSVCVLLNAVYFKGTWSKPFDPKLTRKVRFTNLDKTTVTCNMMVSEDYYKLRKGKGFTALSMLYEGEKTSMVIFLPDKGKSLTDFEKVMTGEGLKNWLKTLDSQRYKNVLLGLPRFTFTSNYDLIRSLHALGVKEAFSSRLSNFRSMGRGRGSLILSQFRHRAFIEVNEQGTEAAAATGGDFGFEGEPEKPVPFVVNRPFLFLIRDEDTGTILFMGRVIKMK